MTLFMYTTDKEESVNGNVIRRVKMVGILMNASVQITNKKEFEELQKRISTPIREVKIKETIQNRINPKKINNEDRECSVDFAGMKAL